MGQQRWAVVETLGQGADEDQVARRDRIGEGELGEVASWQEKWVKGRLGMGALEKLRNQ